MTIILQTQSLSKRYGHVLAVDAVDLRVDRGEVYGFLGLNGAGKSTTIRALLGMIRPSSGVVSLFGAPIIFESGWTSGIGIAPSHGEGRRASRI